MAIVSNHADGSVSDSANASDDQADVASTRRGDGEAYARIIRRHQQRVARRMTRFARSSSEIPELTHDVFVEAYLSINQYRGDAPLDHWIQVIATRVGYRHWKTHRREREQRERLKWIATPDAALPVEYDDELALVLNRLSPPDRLAVTLLHLEGHSVAQAARLAGWSETRMKVQAYRARQKLKRLLEERASHGK